MNYTQLLREHNLKATPQRLAITNILHSRGHVNIEYLYEDMLHKFKSISLATIYKNINLMLENSFIQEVKIPHSKSVFELTKEAHSHLICDECASIEDISINLNAILNETSKSTQFQITAATIVLSGICTECQKTTKG
jgi:Fur family transcriptional regulator, peroxide stress response regulator